MTRRVVAALALALLCACNPSAQTSSSPVPSPSPTSTSLSLKITGRGTATQPVRFVAQQAQGNRVQYDLLARSFESIGAQRQMGAVHFDRRTGDQHDAPGTIQLVETPFRQRLPTQQRDVAVRLRHVSLSGQSGSASALGTVEDLGYGP